MWSDAGSSGMGEHTAGVGLHQEKKMHFTHTQTHTHGMKLPGQEMSLLLLGLYTGASGAASSATISPETSSGSSRMGKHKVVVELHQEKKKKLQTLHTKHQKRFKKCSFLATDLSEDGGARREVSRSASLPESFCHSQSVSTPAQHT